MEVSIERAAQILRENDNIIILTHVSPDGDTLGSAYAICHALQKAGKNARIVSEKVPLRYSYLSDSIITPGLFEEGFIVAVDVATEDLLPQDAEPYKGRIDLCIDHHSSNTHYAKCWCVEPNAAACAEVVFKIISLLDIKIDREIANCLFTGLTTDTGCFRYSNVTWQTMNTAAQLMKIGCDSYRINKLMFENNSKARVAVEQMALSTLEYFYDGKIAVILVTLDMLQKSGVTNDGELEGIASVPRTIEGVVVGITIREKSDGALKISVRSDEALCNANILCSSFGGGGHKAAGGCTIIGKTIEQAKKELVCVAERILRGET